MHWVQRGLLGIKKSDDFEPVRSVRAKTLLRVAQEVRANTERQEYGTHEHTRAEFVSSQRRVEGRSEPLGSAVRFASITWDGVSTTMCS
jgi:hypothetical protein